MDSGESPRGINRRTFCVSFRAGMTMLVLPAFSGAALKKVPTSTGIDAVFVLFNSRLWMATDKSFIGIVCLGMLGLITDRFFRYLIVRFAHQYGPIE